LDRAQRRDALLRRPFRLENVLPDPIEDPLLEREAGDQEPVPADLLAAVPAPGAAVLHRPVLRVEGAAAGAAPTSGRSKRLCRSPAP
jgi:hypothetical protein